MSTDCAITTTWTGNTGTGTSSYDAYERAYEMCVSGKPAIPGSSAPIYRGLPDRYTPEKMLLASVSACHMLWYLHLASDADVIVLSYEDRATGSLRMHPSGAGEFSRIDLSPVIEVATPEMVPLAGRLHDDAGRMCFIARSLACDVMCVPEISART